VASYIGNKLQAGEFKKLDSIESSFDGSTTTFNLSFNGTSVIVGDVTNITVSLNGVIQEPTEAYTLATGGSQIVFSTAPASGSDCFITQIGSVGGTATPSDDSVSTVKIQDGAIHTAKVADNAVTSGKLHTAVTADIDSKAPKNEPTFTGDYVKIPVGGTGDRPTATAGYLRFNTDEATIEQYDGSNWNLFPKAALITSLSYSGSVTAVDPAGGETVTISGANFEAGVNVKFGNTLASAVTRNSSTSLTVTTPALTAGDYDVQVINGNGIVTQLINGLSVNANPAWSSPAAGSLGNILNDQLMTNITLVAAEDDSGTITYTVTSGALPNGVSISNDTIQGTPTGYSASTAANFTITATDDENQTATRSFTLTVIVNFYEYEVANSLRFDLADASNLTWTPSGTATDSRKWTFSCWVKGHYNNGNSYGYIFSAGTIGNLSSAPRSNYYLHSNGRFAVNENTSGGTWYQLETYNELWRDPNAWYHIVYVFDSAQATDSNRQKLYINGQQQNLNESGGGSYVPQNSTSPVNTNTLHMIGANAPNQGAPFYGYITEFNFVDGQALAPTDFAETKEDVWVPKAYTGTYGNNGFYLPMTHDDTVEGFSTNLWSPNSTSQSDPTRNGNYFGGVGFSPDFTWIKCRGTGYGHALFDKIRGPHSRLQTTSSPEAASLTYGKTFEDDGMTFGVDYGQNSPETEPYVQWSWDMGDWSGPNLISNGVFTDGDYTGWTVTQGSWSASADGLTGPDGDGKIGQDITTVVGEKYFILVRALHIAGNFWVRAYDGSTVIAGGAYGGNPKQIEFTATSTTTRINFETNGTNEWYVHNVEVRKANTDGSKAAIVKANPTYGQSMVSYIGSATASTIGHGLNSAPEIIIAKNTETSGEHWNVYTAVIGAAKFLELSSNVAEQTATNRWNDTAPTSSVFTVGVAGTTNGNSDRIVAYCFHSVSGYSKMGSYSGTNSTNNTITGLGFRPAWLMVKSVDSSSNWEILDTTRGPGYASSGIERLAANLDDGGQTGYLYADINDDGFTVGNSGIPQLINASSNTYIYMAFADKRSLAFWKDASGNANHFTPRNINRTDLIPESPTNNFAVLNRITESRVSTTSKVAQGSLKTINSSTTSDKNYHLSSMRVSSGKWYVEYYGTSGYAMGGVTYFDSSRWVNQNGSGGISYFGSQDEDYAYFGVTGEIYTNSSATSYGATYGNGDIIGIALDLDSATNTVTFYKNNVSQGAYNLPSDKRWGFGFGQDLASHYHYINFGQDSSFAGTKASQGNTDSNGNGDFYYTPPTDHLALCNANLPNNPFDLLTGEKPSDHFGAIAYSGNGSTQSITGLNFQPDLVWIKSRTGVRWHQIFDVNRGAYNFLSSDQLNEEIYDVNTLSSFNSNGFSLGTSNRVNGSSENYVAWCWKANGTPVSNTDGSITTQVSANTNAGFSIISYTGNLTAGATIGHGLNQTPDMIIFKSVAVTTGGSAAWGTWHSDLAADTTLKLNTAEPAASANDLINQTLPTSSVISLGSVKESNRTEEMICYAWHSVPGFSKIGKYYGNGSADGPFTYTGFKPAFLLVKNITTNGEYWWMIDNARDLNNPVGHMLYPNVDIAEQAPPTYTNYVDFLSNGFKIRSTPGHLNTDGNVFVYMAFAEDPFKYGNAR